jgi:hypothetical protein
LHRDAKRLSGNETEDLAFRLERQRARDIGIQMPIHRKCAARTGIVVRAAAKPAALR